MNTINIKGEQNARDKSKVKLIAIFHRTGFCRARKVIKLTGSIKDWDETKQQFKGRSVENEEKTRLCSSYKK